MTLKGHMTITCGIDWAEGHHDVALVNAEGERVAKLRIDTGLTGFTELMTPLAEHTDDPAGVSVAIETDKVLIVTALRAAGLDVYAINPRAVARHRERWGQAGGKSDRGDALVLANVLRTDRHLHRRLPAISEAGRAVKVLARQHQEAIWVRQATVSRLRSLLIEYYPNALTAFPILTHRPLGTHALTNHKKACGEEADPGQGRERRSPVPSSRSDAHGQHDRGHRDRASPGSRYRHSQRNPCDGEAQQHARKHLGKGRSLVETDYPNHDDRNENQYTTVSQRVKCVGQPVRNQSERKLPHRQGQPF